MTAKQREGWHRHLPKDILDLYDVRNYHHAAEVLASGCRQELDEIVEALRAFRLTIADIRKAGGNESAIPKRFTTLLRPKGWKETRIIGDLVIRRLVTDKATKPSKKADEADVSVEDAFAKLPGHKDTVKRANFLDGHKIDYLKGRVALDLEWNSKDQTFDRDLYAFRAFHECGLISAAVLVTRSEDLNEVFTKLGIATGEDGQPLLNKKGKAKLVKEKYGASTTWMGKLLYRLEAGRNGGCPVLVVGITRRLIEDWKE